MSTTTSTPVEPRPWNLTMITEDAARAVIEAGGDVTIDCGLFDAAMPRVTMPEGTVRGAHEGNPCYLTLPCGRLLAGTFSWQGALWLGAIPCNDRLGGRKLPGDTSPRIGGMGSCWLKAAKRLEALRSRCHPYPRHEDEPGHSGGTRPAIEVS